MKGFIQVPFDPRGTFSDVRGVIEMDFGICQHHVKASFRKLVI
jgi:hypothetical protein